MHHDRPSLPASGPATDIDQLAAGIGGHPIDALAEIDFDGLRHQVLLTGSFVDGFGNTSSDVDFFVIGPEIDSRTEMRFSPRLRRMLDITYLPLADVIAAFRSVEQGADGRGRRLRFSEADLCHRLAGGMSVTTIDHIGGQRPTKERLGAAQAWMFVDFARSIWADAAGAFASGYGDQAYYCARMALEHAIDGYLSLLGETNPAAKWRWAKLSRVAEDPLKVREAQYWRLPALRPSDSTLPTLDELLDAAGATLFQLQGRLVDGSYPSRPSNVPVGSRLERAHSGTFLVGLDGVATVQDGERRAQASQR